MPNQSHTNNEEECEFIELVDPAQLGPARLKLAMATIAHHALVRDFLDQAPEEEMFWLLIDAEEEFLALVDTRECGPHGDAAASIRER